jgi:hemolysin type calcium-binding protein
LESLRRHENALTPDRLDGGPGRDTILGHRGNNVIRARDGFPDPIDCGAGRDTVYADRFDAIARNCEQVIPR